MQGILTEFSESTSQGNESAGTNLDGKSERNRPKAFQSTLTTGLENSYIYELNSFCIQVLYLGWQPLDDAYISQDHNFIMHGRKVHDEGLVQAPLLCLDTKLIQWANLEVHAEMGHLFTKVINKGILSTEEVQSLHIQGQLIQVGFTFSRRELKKAPYFEELIFHPWKKNQTVEEDVEKKAFKEEAAKYRRYTIAVETLDKLKMSPVHGEVY